MRISLIGMSNSGKTYWSKQLESKSFMRFSCDDFIQQKLEKKLKNIDFTDIHDVAEWMGQPFANQYKQTSQQYLQFEIESIKQILNTVRKNHFSTENIVVDTTGSVIYINSSLLKELKQLTQVVYLETPQSVQKEMVQVYLNHPKPVFWGNSFTIHENELPREALVRCYPELLKFRAEKYKQLADCILDYYLLRDKNFTAQNFLSLI